MPSLACKRLPATQSRSKSAKQLGSLVACMACAALTCCAVPTTPLQLMSEHRSRLNACNTTEGWSLDFYRVDRASGPFLPRHLWRKSSQVRRGGWDGGGGAWAEGPLLGCLHLPHFRPLGRVPLGAQHTAQRRPPWRPTTVHCPAPPQAAAAPLPAPAPQWFVLNRKHAELVLADRAVERLFQLNCYTSLERADGRMWERVCYSGARCNSG